MKDADLMHVVMGISNSTAGAGDSLGLEFPVLLVPPVLYRTSVACSADVGPRT
jgi:hypothetical protein